MAQKQVQSPSFQALEATVACMAEYQHRHSLKNLINYADHLYKRRGNQKTADIERSYADYVKR